MFRNNRGPKAVEDLKKELSVLAKSPLVSAIIAIVVIMLILPIIVLAFTGKIPSILGIFMVVNTPAPTLTSTPIPLPSYFDGFEGTISKVEYGVFSRTAMT